MHICNQRAYLLTQSKIQGLPLAQLQQVFHSIILARLLYAAPAFGGYLSSTDINCCNSFWTKPSHGTLPLVNATLLCLNHR